MADKNKLIAMMGKNKAERMMKNTPSAAEFCSLHYDIDEENGIYKFNIASNDAVLTCSGKGERRCHTASHIAQNKTWAETKMYLAGISAEGTVTPSWFESKEQLSDLMEELFLTKDLSGLEKWAKDRDIYYYDSKENRYVVSFVSENETGKFMFPGSKKAFPCHGVKFVFEYTEFRADGEYAILTAYPIPTEMDKDNAFHNK